MLQYIITLEGVKDSLSASTLSYLHPISQDKVSRFILKEEMTEKYLFALCFPACGIKLWQILTTNFKEYSQS